MPKCDLQLYWNHTSVWVFPCEFAAYFHNIFSEHLFLRTPLEGCFCRFLNKPLITIFSYTEDIQCRLPKKTLTLVVSKKMIILKHPSYIFCSSAMFCFFFCLSFYLSWVKHHTYWITKTLLKMSSITLVATSFLYKTLLGSCFSVSFLLLPSISLVASLRSVISL